MLAPSLGLHVLATTIAYRTLAATIGTRTRDTATTLSTTAGTLRSIAPATLIAGEEAMPALAGPALPVPAITTLRNPAKFQKIAVRQESVRPSV